MAACGRRRRENTPKRFTVMHLLKASAQPKTARGPTRVHHAVPTFAGWIEGRTTRQQPEPRRQVQQQAGRTRPGNIKAAWYRRPGRAVNNPPPLVRKGSSRTNRGTSLEFTPCYAPADYRTGLDVAERPVLRLLAGSLTRRANTDRQSHECPPPMRHAGTIRFARSSPRSRPGSCSSSCSSEPS